MTYIMSYRRTGQALKEQGAVVVCLPFSNNASHFHLPFWPKPLKREKKLLGHRGGRERYKYLMKDWHSRCGQHLVGFDYSSSWLGFLLSCFPLTPVIALHASTREKVGKTRSETQNWKCSPVEQTWSFGSGIALGVS